MWKQFPDLRPFRSLEQLLDVEVRWLDMQMRIDDGLQCCSACDRFGYHRFCGHCGKRYVNADSHWWRCVECHIETTTDYCPQCGEQLATEFLRRIESGEMTWEELGARATAAVNRVAAREPHINALLRGQQQPQADIIGALNDAFGGGDA